MTLATTMAPFAQKQRLSRIFHLLRKKCGRERRLRLRSAWSRCRDGDQPHLGTLPAKNKDDSDSRRHSFDSKDALTLNAAGKLSATI